MSQLPIDSVLPQLRETFAERSSVVLQAPPGAGKTTRVPLALLDEPWLAGQTILILEPRRLATRAAAERMAAELGERVGETVGYRVRFESRVSNNTRIEVLTEGILTRRIQRDPELRGVGLVIFDEFHERHLHGDLALALCLDIQGSLREELRLLVMSATLDGTAVSGLLNAPVVASEGRSYPVEIIHRPVDPAVRLPQAMASAIEQVLAETSGDILAFLPGTGEIRRTAELLESRSLSQAVVVRPLYGELSLETQQAAIRPDPQGKRRVVLATNIAETSLTIEGVGVVVDGGWMRVPRFDPRTGLTRLETVRVSRASAEQRAGRAGRLGPGICYRLWSEGIQRGLVPFNAPEILEADLAPLALDLAQWGIADPSALLWLDPPPRGALAQARSLLQLLGALDGEGRITEAGRSMGKIPAHPRLAHMIVEGQRIGLGTLACDLAAILSEREVFRGGIREQELARHVEVLRLFRREGRSEATRLGADPGACSVVDRASRQWRRLIDNPPEQQAHDDDIGLLAALAYPDRIALSRSGRRFQMSNRRGVQLPEGSRLEGQSCLVACAVDLRGDEGVVQLAAPLSLERLRPNAAHLFNERVNVEWDNRQQAVNAVREERVGEAVLRTEPLKNVAPERMVEAMLEGIGSLGLAALPWTSEARALQARVLCLREWCPEEGLPDLSDVALAESLETWLAPYLSGITKRDQLNRLDLRSILLGLLDWSQQRRLEEGAPEYLTVPSGQRRRLDYQQGAGPTLAVKLQEMFGQADTPRIAWGRIPVTLHLLSPAQRPIQVTQDLRGFWERTYAEVKKELKGRYPKHPWPDDPWTAEPTARAKRRT